MSSESVNIEPEMRPKRRWFRYSLRTFMVAVLLCGTWLGLKIKAAREQKRAAYTVQTSLGSAKYEEDFDEIPVDPSNPFGGPLPTRIPRGPNWLTKILGVDLFHDVTEVSAQGDHRDALVEFLNQLKYFPHVRLISLQNRNLRNDDLAYVSGLRYVESIKLSLSLRGESQI